MRIPPARFAWLKPGAMVFCVTLMVEACGQTAAPAGTGAGGANGENDGSNGSGDGSSAGGDGSHAGGDGGGGLPELGCSAVAPAAFTRSCGGCHTTDGAGAYPNLHDFDGSEAEFLEKARQGGGGMPAFPADIIDDEALRAAYAFFTGDGAARPEPTFGGVVPLFPAARDVVPITFMRDDGVLVTRAAGRVRQRHELEETYGPFGPHYFEDRTYGFIVEDFTPKGESRIRVTYLPVARPQDKTNFRAFKVYGDGNVFHANMGMTSDVQLPSLTRGGLDMAADYAARFAPFARVQQQEVTRNPREDRDLMAGDVFEFEFGVFIDEAEVRAGSRFSYYTDTFRYRVGKGGLTPENADTSGDPGPVREARLGDGATVGWAYAEPQTYFSQMALNIQHEHVQRFVEGRRLFHTDFGTGAHSEGGNPEFPEQANKLGPLFATRNCETCHVQNGGGHALDGALSEQSSMAFKLYDAGELGNQLQLQEGSASLASTDTKDVTLGDGTVVTLTRPRFAVTANSGAVTRYSARIARRLIGMGLLEAVEELTLLGRADPEDCDGDGISGRPSFVSDPESSALRIGRFGWKAEKVSVEHQVADALDADLGVQSRIKKGANGEVELADDDLARLTTYMRLVGVPPQREREDEAVVRGELLFRATGCASCHAPEVTTGANHDFVELRGQDVRPFTDLLLHDLGEDLADDSGEAGDRTGDAKPSASEWRTPPLWGVGLLDDVQGKVSLLHDGRAHSVLEAVLWHGGEATSVRERFGALSREDRDALIRFVESL